MRLLTDLQNREMEQLVNALRVPSIAYVWEVLGRCLEVKNMQLSMDAEKPLDLLLAAGLILRHLCAKARERLSFRQSVWQQSESWNVTY